MPDLDQNTLTGQQMDGASKDLSPSMSTRFKKMHASLGQSMLSLSDQGVVSLVNFLTGIIIARACSKEELGLYSLGFSLNLIMADLQSSLIMTPYMIHAPRLKGREHALYTGSTLLHQVGFCLLTILGLGVAALFSARGMGPKGLSNMMASMVFVVTFLMLREHARRVSFARLQIRVALIFDLTISSGQIIGLLLLAHYKQLSASRAFYVIGTMCAIAVCGWLWWDRKFYEPRLRQAFRDFKRNWVTGRWLLASGLLWTVGLNLYPWLLAGMKGIGATGIWAACMAVVSAGNPILIGLQNLIGPKVAHSYVENGPRGAKRLIQQMALLTGVPLTLICLVVFFYGGSLLTRLYGPQFAGNSRVMCLLCLSVLVTGVTFAQSRTLFAMGRADIDFKVNFMAVLFTLTAGLWLVHSYGTLGAALSLLTANILTSLYRNGELRRALSRATNRLPVSQKG